MTEKLIKTAAYPDKLREIMETLFPRSISSIRSTVKKRRSSSITNEELLQAKKVGNKKAPEMDNILNVAIKTAKTAKHLKCLWTCTMHASMRESFLSIGSGSNFCPRAINYQTIPSISLCEY